jgi:hypothetical protein
MNMRIRAAGRQEFWRIAEAAKSRGLDLAELLDREGVLLTPDRQVAIRAAALEEMAEFFDNISVQSLTGKTIGVTGNDVKAAVAELLRTMARHTA